MSKIAEYNLLYLRILSDAFSDSPSEYGKLALKTYNSCWDKITYKNFDSDKGCRVQAVNTVIEKYNIKY